MNFNKKIVYFLLLVVLSHMQTVFIVDGSPSDIRGNFKVSKYGQDLTTPSSIITIRIQFVQIKVLGCNYAFALYDFDPVTFRLLVQNFKQPDFGCVVHEDRSVMEQLLLATTARRQNDVIVFKNASDKTILQLVPSQISYEQNLQYAKNQVNQELLYDENS